MLPDSGQARAKLRCDRGDCCLKGPGQPSGAGSLSPPAPRSSGPIGPEGSALKLYWSEMSQRLHRLALDVLGPAAPLGAGAGDNPGGGEWQRSWLYYQASSIWAGTNEIERNILSERVLGMPRDPK